METTREKILSYFLQNPGREISLYELLQALSLKRDYLSKLLEDVGHVAKTLKRQSTGRYQLLMRAPFCRSCGYVFKDLEKARIPSRCPRCKSERISPPAFMLVERG
ncbi:MAG: hypothetical protein QXT33_04965 [Thermofilum sp.]|uniref:Transcriptional regulator n=1 Tax=Thermofilum pendens TaxID=2269 RepID=A0A7C4D489_THEPE